MKRKQTGSYKHEKKNLFHKEIIVFRDIASNAFSKQSIAALMAVTHLLHKPGELPVYQGPGVL